MLPLPSLIINNDVPDGQMLPLPSLIIFSDVHDGQMLPLPSLIIIIKQYFGGVMTEEKQNTPRTHNKRNKIAAFLICRDLQG